jgi:hypothetical protein
MRSFLADSLSYHFRTSICRSFFHLFFLSALFACFVTGIRSSIFLSVDLTPSVVTENLEAFGNARKCDHIPQTL